MSSNETIVRRLIHELKEDPEARRELQELLLRDYTIEGEPSLLQIIHDMLQELKQLRIDMNRGFEESNKRFEALTAEMNRHFEESNKRFEALTTEMNRRFEESNKRFEALTTEMNRRFEESNKRFEALTTEMNRRFEESNKRFEALTTEMNRRFEGIMKAFQDLRRDVATMSTRYGFRLEDIFRDVFREALKLEGIDPESIRRLVVIDPTGEVVDPGETTDLDIYMHNNECVAIEVKARVDSHDIRRFEKTIQLAEKQEGIKVTKRIIITLHITPEDRLKAERKGIIVITSER